MRVFRATYKDRKGRQRESSKWYVEFRDHLEMTRRLPAFTDKKASQEVGRRIERLVSLRLAGEGPDAELTRWLETALPRLKTKLVEIGLLDASRGEAAKPLVEHIEDWQAFLTAKGNTAAHVKLAVSRVKRILGEFTTLHSILAQKVHKWLSERREAGLSRRTSNFYLSTAKSFCAWLVRNRRISENPLQHLQSVSAKEDTRHARRALNTGEIRALLAAAEAGPERYGMTGPERALCYRLALETGLRRNEIKTLTARCLDLDANPPTVTVLAAYSKHRREDKLPLRLEMAEALRELLYSKAAQDLVFPKLPRRAAAMLRLDLEAAGISYVDEAGRFADFHSLRHTFISELSRSGIHPKVAQSLARHSTIVLTMDRYTAPALLETQAEAVNRLPEFVAVGQELKREGTTDSVLASCLLFSGGFSGTSVDSNGQKDGADADVRTARKPAKTLGKPAKTSLLKKIRPAGFEPATPGLGNRCSIH